MGETQVKNVLKNFGLSENETEVYIFLSKHGIQKGLRIARQLKKDKAQVYRTLKSLQKKGLVETTLESPKRFLAVPFETALELFIKTKRQEAALLEKSKKALLKDWESISKTRMEPPLEKFVVIEGSKKIFLKIIELTKNTKKELSTILTVPGLLRAYQLGLFNVVQDHSSKKIIQFRFLTDLTSENLNTMSFLIDKKPKLVNFKIRNPGLGLQLSPRMLIRDREEILFFITPKSDNSAKGQKDVCLLTNCKELVNSFEAVFEDLWLNSTDMDEKIVEVETGKPTPKAFAMYDEDSARKRYNEIIHLAEQEITIMTSSEGLTEVEKNLSQLKGHFERGVTIKIMAPIINENVKAAIQLSEFCFLRHIPDCNLRTTLVDGKHIFQFNKQSLDKEESKAELNRENAFYSNDFVYTQKMKIMLDHVWKKASTLSTIQLKKPKKPTMDSVKQRIPDETCILTRPGTRYKKMIWKFEEPRKLSPKLTERDVLNKIINAKKYPAKDPTKDMVRYYGSSARAIIHPPENFNIPDMIIHACHWDKQSSFGAEDVLFIHLWLETPKGFAFVPVAVVQDNPEAMAFSEPVFVGTPAAQNHQLLGKKELTIRVYGNTLFAGWTKQIPLLPPKYILPPSCILFEAFGRVRSGIVKSCLPSSRTQISEFNCFEAFATFFHPSSKYSVPGTEGMFSREIVVTTYPGMLE